MRRILPAVAVVCLLTAGTGFADDDLMSRAAEAERDGYLKQAFALYLQAWQSVSESSDDLEVRGALVRLAAQLDPPPEFPEDAQRYAARAQVAFSQASGVRGFEESAREFRQAVHAAPWWAEAAFNLALVEERLGRYDASIAELKIYLLSDPQDAARVRSKVYQLEYHKERAPATVYVIRPRTRLIGSAGQVTVRIDGNDVAQLGNGSYLVTRLAPGTHSLQFWSRAMGITSHSKIKTLDLIANQTYSIRMKVNGDVVVKPGADSSINTLTLVPLASDPVRPGTAAFVGGSAFDPPVSNQTFQASIPGSSFRGMNRRLP